MQSVPHFTDNQLNRSLTAILLKADLFYWLLNKTHWRKETWVFIFNNKSPHSCPLQPPTPHHFVVLSVSSIPVHGHNSGSGSLNIEGNSIWPCFSDRTWRASSQINLTEDHILLGHASLVAMWLPSSDCSYRVTGCQSLCPVQLRALVDSELGMFGVLWTGMYRAKIKRW